MKRYIISLIALSAAVIGCTKSGLVESPQKYQEPITFETYTGKTPTTKATEVTTATLATHTSKDNPAFHVNAFLVSDPQTYTNAYMNKDVYSTSETPTADATNQGFYNSWTYEGATYWPDNGSLLFVAYGLNADKMFGAEEAVKDESGNEITPAVPGTPTMTFSNYANMTYTVPAKTSEQEDLIVAVPTTQGISNNVASNVLLNFKHMLSKVGFSLKTDATNNVIITIKSIKLKGAFNSTGDVNLAVVDATTQVPFITTGTRTSDVSSYSLFDTNYGETGATGPFDCFQITKSPGATPTPIYPNTTYTPSTGEDVSNAYAGKTGASENNRYMMLIPGTQANATIEVVYELEGAKEQKATASLGSEFKFEAGKAYEFVIKMNTSSIEFEAGITDWNDTTIAGESIVLKPVIQ